jgi:hypothetical protein
LFYTGDTLSPFEIPIFHTLKTSPARNWKRYESNVIKRAITWNCS